MTSLLSYLNGITAVAIYATGWISGLKLLAINKRSPSKLLPWAAIVLIAFSSFYTGTVVYFVYLLVTGMQFEPLIIGAWLCYTVTPLAAASSQYLGCMLFKPKFAKLVRIILFALGIVYVIYLWFVPGTVSIPPPTAGELIDIENIGWTKYLLAGIIITMFVFLVGGFTNLAKKASGSERKIAIYFAIGFALFGISAIGDGLLALEPISLLIIRSIMLTAFLFLYVASSRMKPK